MSQCLFKFELGPFSFGAGLEEQTHATSLCVDCFSLWSWQCWPQQTESAHLTLSPMWASADSISLLISGHLWRLVSIFQRLRLIPSLYLFISRTGVTNSLGVIFSNTGRERGLLLKHLILSTGWYHWGHSRGIDWSRKPCRRH